MIRRDALVALYRGDDFCLNNLSTLNLPNFYKARNVAPEIEIYAARGATVIYLLTRGQSLDSLGKVGTTVLFAGGAAWKSS